jgi:hypothetical protein
MREIRTHALARCAISQKKSETYGSSSPKNLAQILWHDAMSSDIFLRGNSQVSALLGVHGTSSVYPPDEVNESHVMPTSGMPLRIP